MQIGNARVMLGLTALAAAIASCGGNDEEALGNTGGPDAGSDVEDTDAGGSDAKADHPATEGGDGGFADIAAGSWTVHVPSESAPDEGIAVRVFHPSTEGRRYEDGAPIAVLAPGGHDRGSLSPEGTNAAVTEHGYITVQFLLPGGEESGVRSGGQYDYRGAGCQRALVDVIRFAMGELASTEDSRIHDHIPFALTSIVGVVGQSNGGNLALTAFSRFGDEVASLAWFAAWESPIGDQAVMVELGGKASPLNPYYVPGTCTVTSCPWPGLEEALRFDPAAPFQLSDPATGKSFDLTGRFYLDEDDDGTKGPNELGLAPMAGPGEVVNGNHLPKAYASSELAEAVEAKAATLFPAGPPAWLADRTEVDAYWSERDGSLVIDQAHALLPNVLVMSLATEEDHVQIQPDYPHVRSHVQGWIDAGHSFVRLNPDAAYLAAATGIDAGSFPDNEVGAPVSYPGIESMVTPETLGGTPIDPFVIPAAIAELSDRVHEANLSPNLGDVLVSH